jgi:hypothetical protein
MSQLIRTGLAGTSLRENEWRLPLHPDHLRVLPEAVRAAIHINEGYGAHFNVADDELRPFVTGVLPRDRLQAESDLVVITKAHAAGLQSHAAGHHVFRLGPRRLALRDDRQGHRQATNPHHLGVDEQVAPRRRRGSSNMVMRENGKPIPSPELMPSTSVPAASLARRRRSG